MSLSERALSALKELGLTGTEVKAYISLLRGGTMTANDVSREARIPYSKVYDALESLHEKGWVDEQKSRPVVYTARPPDTAIAELKSRYEAERREKEQYALQELIGVQKNKSEQEKQDIWIVRGYGEILSRVKSLLLNCRTELLIALPPQLLPFTDQLLPLMATLKEKGVKGQLLTSPSVSAASIEQLSRVAEVRARKTMYGGGVIADAREVVLLLGGGDQPNTPLKGSLETASQHEDQNHRGVEDEKARHYRLLYPDTRRDAYTRSQDGRAPCLKDYQRDGQDIPVCREAGG